jgi:predicted Mrr-cat superfamily restriction endonuclease
MSLWVVRAGRYGEQEETALKEHLVCHGWNELPDYSTYRTKDELQVLYKATYPQATEKQVTSGLGQVWRFAHEVQKGDLRCRSRLNLRSHSVGSRANTSTKRLPRTSCISAASSG